MTVRVAMWSGPRNISTAMMRAWENRPDTRRRRRAVLRGVPGPHRARPSRPRRGDRRRRDRPGDEVVDALLGAAARRRAGATTQKHMTHHLLPDMDLDWIARLPQRAADPRPGEVVASYVQSREACEPEDIGLLQQVALLDELDRRRAPPVIDAGDFLRDPEAHLRWLCDWLGIAFTDRMLHWPAGPARHRRRLGAALVRRGVGLDRLRAVPPDGEVDSTTTTPRSPRRAARRTRRCGSGGCGSAQLSSMPPRRERVPHQVGERTAPSRDRGRSRRWPWPRPGTRCPPRSRNWRGDQGGVPRPRWSCPGPRSRAGCPRAPGSRSCRRSAPGSCGRRASSPGRVDAGSAGRSRVGRRRPSP